MVSYRPSCYRTGFHTGLEGCIINPVSYTHLDVYKRQRQVQSMLCSLAARWYLIARVAIAPGDALFTGRQVVSYRPSCYRTGRCSVHWPPGGILSPELLSHRAMLCSLAARWYLIARVAIAPGDALFTGRQVVSYRPSCYRTGRCSVHWPPGGILSPELLSHRAMLCSLAARWYLIARVAIAPGDALFTGRQVVSYRPSCYRTGRCSVHWPPGGILSPELLSHRAMLCSLAARWYLIARVAIAPGSILALKDALSTRSMQGTTSGLRAPP
ncbi:hypothetical protein, partial [Erwinia amylovora]